MGVDVLPTSFFVFRTSNARLLGRCFSFDYLTSDLNDDHLCLQKTNFANSTNSLARKWFIEQRNGKTGAYSPAPIVVSSILFW